MGLHLDLISKEGLNKETQLPIIFICYVMINSGIELGGEELNCCQLADDATIFLQNEHENTYNECVFFCIRLENVKKCDLFSLKDNLAALKYLKFL